MKVSSGGWRAAFSRALFFTGTHDWIIPFRYVIAEEPISLFRVRGFRASLFRVADPSRVSRRRGFDFCCTQWATSSFATMGAGISTPSPLLAIGACRYWTGGPGFVVEVGVPRPTYFVGRGFFVYPSRSREFKQKPRPRRASRTGHPNFRI